MRVPDHPVARDILAAFGRPVVAPSANRSGHVSPTTAQHVLGDLRGRIDLIVDGGPTPVGVESTIVACLGEPVLLRPGGVPRAEIERVLGHALRIESGAGGSGRRAARARPARLALCAAHAGCGSMRQDVGPGEALLAFGRAIPAGAARAVRTLNLSPRGDLIEAAANLFSHLRALDAAGAAAIAVMPVPHERPRRGDQRPAQARRRAAA